MQRLVQLPAQLEAARFTLDSFAPAPHAHFYGLVNVAGVKFNVGTEVSVFVQDPNGRPLADALVFNMRGDGRFERIGTNGQGLARFDLGGGARFFGNEKPPHKIFVGTGGEPMDDEHNTPVAQQGDAVFVGFPDGSHFEGAFTFEIMGADVPPPPTGEAHPNWQHIAEGLRALARDMTDLATEFDV